MISDSDESCIEEVPSGPSIVNESLENTVNKNHVVSGSDEVITTTNENPSVITNDVTGRNVNNEPLKEHTADNCHKSKDINCVNVNETFMSISPDPCGENDNYDISDNSPVQTSNENLNAPVAKSPTREPGEILSDDDCDTSDTTADVMDSLDLSDPLLDETFENYNKIKHEHDNKVKHIKREQELTTVSVTGSNDSKGDTCYEQTAKGSLGVNNGQNVTRKETPMSIMNLDLHAKEIKQELINMNCNDDIDTTKGEMYQQLVGIECKLEHDRLTEADLTNWLLKERENLEPSKPPSPSSKKRSKPQVAKKKLTRLADSPEAIKTTIIVR